MVDIAMKMSWHWQIVVPWIIPLLVRLAVVVAPVVVDYYYCYNCGCCLVNVAVADGVYVSPIEEELTDSPLMGLVVFDF